VCLVSENKTTLEISVTLIAGFHRTQLKRVEVLPGSFRLRRDDLEAIANKNYPLKQLGILMDILPFGGKNHVESCWWFCWFLCEKLQGVSVGSNSCLEAKNANEYRIEINVLR